VQQLDQSGGERLRRGRGEQWWQWYWQGEGADQRSREVVVIVGEEEGEQAAFQTRSANDILDDGYRWRKYSAHPRFVVRFLDPSLNYYLVSHHSFSSEARGLMGSQYLLALLSLSCNTN